MAFLSIEHKPKAAHRSAAILKSLHRRERQHIRQDGSRIDPNLKLSKASGT